MSYEFTGDAPLGTCAVLAGAHKSAPCRLGARL